MSGWMRWPPPAEAQGGGEASEGWHAALDSASELVSNAPDARYRKRAEQVRDWIKAHPAEAQPVAWSADKPGRPGVYGVRGFNLCREPEEQFEAVVSVRLYEGDLICNLHEYTSEEDFDRWTRVEDCSDGFEWCEFVPAHPPPSAPVGVSSTEREWLQYAIDHMRDDNEPEDATCADVLEALLNRVESAPVGVELAALRVQEWLHAEHDLLVPVQEIEAAMRTPCSCPATEQSLAQQPAADKTHSDPGACPACNRAWAEHKFGYSAATCKMKQPAAVDGVEPRSGARYSVFGRAFIEVLGDPGKAWAGLPFREFSDAVAARAAELDRLAAQQGGES